MLNMMMQHCLVGGDGRDSGRVALIDSSVFLEHPPPPIPPPPPPPPTPPPPARANQPIMLLCQQAAISILYAQISYQSDKSHTIIYKCWEPF